MVTAERLGFVRALADPELCSNTDARTVLERADRLGVDALRVIADRFSISSETLYVRAARLLSLRYVVQPAGLLAKPGNRADPDGFATIRSARAELGDGEVTLSAPDFDRLVTLRKRLMAQPGLRERVAITTPAALRHGLATASHKTLVAQAMQRLSRTVGFANAHLDLTIAVRAGFVIFLATILGVVFLAPLTLQLVLLPILTVFLLIPSLFRVWAAITIRRIKPLVPFRVLGDAELPVYSVLIPLRDEANMVPQIVRAMRRLDYPVEKLDIVFVVESDSTETVAAVRRCLDDGRFGLIVVPRRGPLTKPKALNYALPFARGAHVVVFDAEDVPDRGQLRRAASLFAEHEDIECLQAELLIVNGTSSWLTAVFAAEYAGHFGVLLPAMARAGLPVPLGGTSNHLRLATLRRIGGWDAFNVTEDADLGIRLARVGLRTGCFAAWTAEEAPYSERAWLKQRTRWMKGWMQTFLVHNRRPGRLLADLGWRNFLAFQVFVGGMFVSLGIHGLFLVLVLARMIANLVADGVIDAWTYAHLVMLALSYVGPVMVSLVGLSRIGRLDLAPMLLLTPLYWLLGWVAVMRGAFELIVRPFHWDKTAHFGFKAIRSDRPGRNGAVRRRATGLPRGFLQSSRSRPA